MNEKIMHALDRWFREISADCDYKPRSLRGKPGDTPVRWFEETRNDGFCDTCWFEYRVVGVEYADGTMCAIEATFAQIVNNLTL